MSGPLDICLTSVPVFADTMEATMSLGRDPEPPICVLNPGGVVDITWNIEHTTTPNYVYYKLEDPTRTLLLEEQTHPGSTGITINRQWIVPGGSVDGKYWIRVEDWLFEAGNEANAEVTFRVCWGGLAYGDYTVYEPALSGMIPVGPTTYDVTVDGDPVEIKFCNQQEPTPTKRSTWGALKGMYR